VTQVQVGGPAAPQGGSPIAIRQDVPIVPQTPQAPQPHGQQQQPIVADGSSGNAGSNLANSSLEEFARGVGEPIVPTGGGNDTANRGNGNHPTPPAPKPTDTTTAAAGGHEYVAQAGDSLSRIASKMMGSNSKANREAIVKANPSLQKNPDVIIEGRKYVIPAAGAVKVATATGTESKPTPAKPANGGAAKAVPVTDLVEPLPGSSAAAAAAAGDTYVVKENDNLWKIAAEQLGSGNAWQQIRDMNKDVLKGGDTVQVNMRLRLPPKPVASAAN
jgi:nucleoid-associated protein YgaU